MTLYEVHSRPELHEPVLVMALEGWIDAGLGASAAMATLLSSTENEVVASFDVDTLLDHRARRPILHLADGMNTGLTWPELHLRTARDAAGTTFLVLAGPEPDHQWRAFADEVGELAGSFGVRLVVGLGAFPAPVPHTRPVRLASTATTEELARQVGFVPGRLDVPAGVQAVIERRFADLGVPAVGLWARVPHYASAMPYPEASAVLLEGLSSVTGVEVDTASLRSDAESSNERIAELIANSEDHVALVEQLEIQVDAEEPTGDEMSFGDLPSGDELAAEIQRFLRNRGR